MTFALKVGVDDNAGDLSGVLPVVPTQKVVQFVFRHDGAGTHDVAAFFQYKKVTGAEVLVQCDFIGIGDTPMAAGFANDGTV